MFLCTKAINYLADPFRETKNSEAEIYEVLSEVFHGTSSEI